MLSPKFNRVGTLIVCLHNFFSPSKAVRVGDVILSPPALAEFLTSTQVLCFPTSRNISLSILHGLKTGGRNFRRVHMKLFCETDNRIEHAFPEKCVNIGSAGHKACHSHTRFFCSLHSAAVNELIKAFLALI